MMRTAALTALVASAAAQSASSFNGYINYTTVTGYFLQDLASTNTTGFDYTAVNFGLINQTYAGVDGAGLTQWQQFEQVVDTLNANSPLDTVYKVFWFGRHGEGYHNAAETYYGTPAWNCYWSELNGNATVSWADADLTPNGIQQALIANAYWKSEIAVQKIPYPQSYYTSPLTRCLRTANFTFSDIPTPEYYPFIPEVKEFFREGISVHTCDRRSNKTYIHNLFPTYTFEAGFAESDPLWNAHYAETSTAQDARSKSALDSVFKGDDHTYISVTSHSGEIASLLRVLGHRSFSLSTGAIIPVLVKAQFLPVADTPVISSAPARSSVAFCTNGPPITSVSTLAQGCVCSGGASTGIVSSTGRISSATGSASSARGPSSTVTTSKTSMTSVSGTVISSKPMVTGASSGEMSSASKTSSCKRSTKSRGISASTTGKTAGTSTKTKVCKRPSSGLSGSSKQSSSSTKTSGSASRSVSTVTPLPSVTSTSSTSSSKPTTVTASYSSSSRSAVVSTSSSTSSKSAIDSSSSSTSSKAGVASSSSSSSSSKAAVSSSSTSSTKSASSSTSHSVTSSTAHTTAMSESLSLSSSTKRRACKTKSRSYPSPPSYPDHGHEGHDSEHGWP